MIERPERFGLRSTDLPSEKEGLSGRIERWCLDHIGTILVVLMIVCFGSWIIESLLTISLRVVEFGVAFNG